VVPLQKQEVMMVSPLEGGSQVVDVRGCETQRFYLRQLAILGVGGDQLSVQGKKSVVFIFVFDQKKGGQKEDLYQYVGEVED